MQSINCVVESEIDLTPRVLQLSGMFDVPPAQKLKREWSGTIPIQEKPWNIGLIVGPSGSGKSTILKNIFGTPKEFEWKHKSVIDDFAKELSIEQISKICSSVGFNTIPSWMKPYHVLSNGERFRVETARRLLEEQETIVIDEFTSVVDRQVAQITSYAVQKQIRKENKKLIVATCHYDVEDWLQPDWILEPDTMTFRWRSLRRRPSIEVSIQRVDYKAWGRFAPFHYLTAELSPAATCYGLFIKEEIVAFAGMLHFPHPKIKNIKRCSRLVTLPDWQGLGLGFILIDAISAANKTLGYETRTYPAHPSFIRAFDKSKNWMLTKKPGIYGSVIHPTSTIGSEDGRSFGGRPCATFKYIGNAMTNKTEAAAFVLGKSLPTNHVNCGNLENNPTNQ